MKLNPNEFALFLGARADRHDGYIMGAVGQNPKELHEWYFNQYKDRKQYSAAQEAQALRWKETALRVWDCQGLADGYLTEKLGRNINVRARNNYASWCGVRGEGMIPAARRFPGVAVFMDNGSYIHHVGFLEKPVDVNEEEGDWWVVEARGVLHGVVRTRLSERRWNRWGWMTEFFEYGGAAEENTGKRNLLRGMTGEDVAELQRDLIAMGYSCGRWGADGEFGKATESALKAFQRDYGLESDGVAGEKTRARLDELLRENGEEQEEKEAEKSIVVTAGNTWNIRTQPDIHSAVLGYAKWGEAFAPSGAQTEVWIGIRYNGEPAWISKKAVAA